DSLAHYQQVLRSVKYDNTNGGPGVHSLTVNFGADDGIVTASTVTATINVAFPVVIDLNGPASGTANSTFWLPSPSGGPISLATATATVTDTQNTNLTSMTVIITGTHTGDQLTFNTSGTSISGNFDGINTLTFNNSDTLDHYQQVLRSIKY